MIKLSLKKPVKTTVTKKKQPEKKSVRAETAKTKPKPKQEQGLYKRPKEYERVFTVESSLNDGTFIPGIFLYVDEQCAIAAFEECKRVPLYNGMLVRLVEYSRNGVLREEVMNFKDKTTKKKR